MATIAALFIQAARVKSELSNIQMPNWYYPLSTSGPRGDQFIFPVWQHGSRTRAGAHQSRMGQGLGSSYTAIWGTCWHQSWLQSLIQYDISGRGSCRNTVHRHMPRKFYGRDTVDRSLDQCRCRELVRGSVIQCAQRSPPGPPSQENRNRRSHRKCVLQPILRNLESLIRANMRS
jgi:hypothetical protein